MAFMRLPAFGRFKFDNKSTAQRVASLAVSQHRTEVMEPCKIQTEFFIIHNMVCLFLLLLKYQTPGHWSSFSLANGLNVTCLNILLNRLSNGRRSSERVLLLWHNFPFCISVIHETRNKKRASNYFSAVTCDILFRFSGQPLLSSYPGMGV